MNAVLTVEALRAGYGGSEVLTGLDCVVNAGEVVALLGRNGMGKSTAVAAIAGVLPITAGTVTIGGSDRSSASPAARYTAGLRTVRQSQPTFAGLSVAENLALVGCRDVGLAAEHFAFLSGRGRQPTGTLSGGEQKMLALARTAVDPGRLWVLDEPTEGLQPANVDRCGQLITDAARRGVGVLLVEQHLALALRVATRWHILERGAVVDGGAVGSETTAQIRKHLTL
jgi:ABC-type branched-subunit amino acid transport system ATPase component